jgi:predicted  nucleic acid-binding Zn-ribbon protein
MVKSCEIRTTSENALEIFDNLPKMLQADISSPSAPAEAVNAVLSGDITTHKDYIALKKRIEELTEELDKADDWNEELTEERDKLKKDLERSESDARIVSTNYDKLREDYEELGDKNTALELELKEARSQPQDAVIIPDPKDSQEYKELLGKATNFKTLMLESKRKANDLEKELSGLKKELEEERDNLGKGSVKLFTIKMTMTEFSKLLDITKGTEVAEIVRNARPMSI